MSPFTTARCLAFSFWHGNPYRFRYIVSLCIRTTRLQQPPLAEQSPTYNKYYTYLTYVWCRHVLFIALDRKIIGEKCSWFRLSLLSDFIMLFFCCCHFTMSILHILYDAVRNFEHNVNFVFEHVWKIKEPNPMLLVSLTRNMYFEQWWYLRNKSKTTFTVMTIALNWGQHIVTDFVENKHTTNRPEI